MFDDCYDQKRILVTGHTGFKGSWLCLFLKELGAEVFGYALPCSDPRSHFRSLGMAVGERLADIRDLESLTDFVKQCQPDTVFHLAAQPLVRQSYAEPIETWTTNLLGTVNLLEACRRVPSVKSIVVATTDKVYQNREWQWGYREIDRLGGRDPYSASKAACEIAIESYRASFFDAGVGLASVRAGNVIGGGDWACDRIVPDIVRAASLGELLRIRFPNARRPWQHVLDCISGYLILGQHLEAFPNQFSEAWNFGSNRESNVTVRCLVEKFQEVWRELQWESVGETQLHESKELHLDTSKAQERLGWCPVWDLDQALQHTASWYREYCLENRVSSRTNLQKYLETARSKSLPWSL